MDALASAARQAARAGTTRHDAVAAARAAGLSWAVTGAGLGMTRQVAQKRFSRPAPGRLVEPAQAADAAPGWRPLRRASSAVIGTARGSRPAKPLTRRYWASAQSILATAHRRRMSPGCQRFTLRACTLTMSMVDSIALVVASVLARAPVTPR